MKNESKYTQFLSDNYKIRKELRDQNIIINSDDEFIDYCLSKKDGCQLLEAFYHYILPAQSITITPPDQFKERVSALQSDIAYFIKLKAEFIKQFELLKECAFNTGKNLDLFIHQDTIDNYLNNQNCLKWYDFLDMRDEIKEMKEKIEENQIHNNDNCRYDDQEKLRKEWLHGQL